MSTEEPEPLENLTEEEEALMDIRSESEASRTWKPFEWKKQRRP
jgi:hypothetical protein